MNITNLKLKNITCFKELEISFKDQNKLKNWSLLIGDNGQGKTTILKSIAIGLCNKEGASALLSKIHGGFLRTKESEGSIEISLEDKNNKTFIITTTIKLEGNNESISQKTDLKNTDRNKIFAVAYGSGRATQGTQSYAEYALVNSLSTLFNYNITLQNAELGASRVKLHAKNEQWEALQKLLKKILMLDPTDSISLETTGLYVKSKWGKISFNALSDGYKSLTSVILDFLNWKLLYESDFDLKNISGIFIIDEIEQHLHPRWQRNIIKILSEQFPNVQFICSTHSPICVLGLADLGDKASQFIKTAYINGHSEINIFNPQQDFMGYRVDQILTSEAFDINDSRSIFIENKLTKYAEIYIKKESDRTPKDKKIFKKLKKELQNLPLWRSQQEKETLEKLTALFKNDKN